jgi:putative copper export protein
MFEFLNIPQGMVDSYFSLYLASIIIFSVAMFGLRLFLEKCLPNLGKEFKEIQFMALQVSVLFLLFTILLYVGATNNDVYKRCTIYAGTGELCLQKQGRLVCQLVNDSNWLNYNISSLN